MRIKPTNFKELVGIDHKGRVLYLQNRVMRKILPLSEQKALFPKNSICIVCNYRFYEKQIDWNNTIVAVGHPFRDSSIDASVGNVSIFPKRLIQIELNESDLVDRLTTIVDSKTTLDKFDFVCFSLFSARGAETKGLFLLPLIDEAAQKAGMKGLIVDYSNDYDKKLLADKVSRQAFKMVKGYIPSKHLNIVHRKMSTAEVCSVMHSSRFSLFPSTRDASPRLISESLVRNVPVLVNNKIYGGWQYITNIKEKTGMFFVGPSVEQVLSKEWQSEKDKYVDDLSRKMRMTADIGHNNSISAAYYQRYGFRNFCHKLAGLININSKNKMKYVCYREFERILRNISKTNK